MSLSLRIFLAYALIVGLAGYFMLQVFMSELKPGMRQSAEDTLVDTANLLAEIVSEDFHQHPQDFAAFERAFQRLAKRQYKANIFSVNKQSSEFRVYMTNQQGIVVYDSDHRDVGRDFSRWNDVYLTLRGQYGARSTQTDPDDELSSVMHVAAPIVKGEEIVGSLTIAKPNFSVQPFIELAENKIVRQAILLILVTFLISLSISWLLTHSIRKLMQYADDASQQKAVELPVMREAELARLANAIENMKTKLEGKEYVEQYVHSLTHELKSPVSAIKGASELLGSDMSEEQRNRFICNIQSEVDRIDEVISRLLSLAKVETQATIETSEAVPLAELLDCVIATKEAAMADKKLTITCQCSTEIRINGDRFLLFQAIDNLLQNAIDFSPLAGTISIAVERVKREQGTKTWVRIRDEGAGIPDYAQDKIFDRFYSLPRPDSNKKSSGLGLCFVKEIAQLHHGSIQLVNRPVGGVEASMIIL